MSTALVTVDHNNYLALQEGSEIREAIEYNLSAGETIEVSDLTRVPTPTGGSVTWTWEGPEGEESSKEIEGILVHVQQRGVLWATEEIGDSQPVLSTHDLVTAHRIGDDIGDIDPEELDRCKLDGGGYDWQKLAYCQWGSGKNGVGKRCKESRMMFVLRASDPWPMVISAQPGSLKTVKPWIKKLPVPHFRAVIALGLEKVKNRGGIDYAQIKPRLVGTLNRESGQVVFDTYTKALRQIATAVQFDRSGEED